MNFNGGKIWKEDHTKLRHLRGNMSPLGVPFVDDIGLLMGQQLGNLGDIRDKLQIEGVGLVHSANENKPEPCVLSMYMYVV